MELFKIYTLEDIFDWNNDYSKQLQEKLLLNLEFKFKIRHKIITTYNDLEEEDKLLLTTLKKEVFANNLIYLFGSRTNGKYIDKKEYIDNKDKYPHIKVSDYDIKSQYKPDVTKLKEFEKKYDVKIDYFYGTAKIVI